MIGHVQLGQQILLPQRLHLDITPRVGVVFGGHWWVTAAPCSRQPRGSTGANFKLRPPSSSTSNMTRDVVTISHSAWIASKHFTATAVCSRRLFCSAEVSWQAQELGLCERKPCKKAE